MTEKKGLKSEVTRLREEIVKLNVEYMDCRDEVLVTKSDKWGTPYHENIEKCVMELVGELEVSTANASPVIACVAKWVFGKDVPLADLPKSSIATTMIDRAHVLAKIQVAEEMLNSQRWDLHSDGTTRDHNKILGHQITTDKGLSFSTGFCPLTSETSATLLDNAIAMIDELADAYSDQEKPEVFKDLLSRMFAVMSDRASVNKAFNVQMSDYRKEQVNDNVDLHFLYCNAHFLLGLSNICEQKLKSAEESLGHPLGRDGNARFHRQESSVARFIRTGCDVLGPRGDEKNGCKVQWESFCEEDLKCHSGITSFRMNRFNNFFEGAAHLYHHKSNISHFFLNYRENLNMKLESVLLDSQDKHLQAFVCAVGLIYYIVSGPFWQMLQGNVEYVDVHKYVQKMYGCFQQWSVDSSCLLENHTNMFPDFPVQKDLVYTSLLTDQGEALNKITITVLQEIFEGFVCVTERQLSDFLPNGKYSEEPSEELHESMKHCKITNLISEYEFGDLDFSQYKRRHASLHYHSSIQMIKRNKTISQFLAQKSPTEQSKYLTRARAKADFLRTKHRVAERKVKEETMKKMQEVERSKIEKKAKKDEYKRTLINAVASHGGPCKCIHDVDRVIDKLKY